MNWKEHTLPAPLSSKTLHGKAVGTNDTVTGLDDQDNTLYGDAFGMTGQTRGGNDVMVGGAGPGIFNRLYGDAHTMTKSAAGGNDTVIGGAGLMDLPVTNLAIGDANAMSDLARGGDDRLVGGEGNAIDGLYGDAITLAGSAQGGGDVLIATAGGMTTFAGPAADTLAGDAEAMTDSTQGGDDTLFGADGAPSVLYGDAQAMSGAARGGGDLLVSGTGDDSMWGDAPTVLGLAQRGADTFRFAPDNGDDAIHDFEVGVDKIDLTAFASIHTIEDLTIAADLIVFADGGTIAITILGGDALSSGDFIFTPA